MLVGVISTLFADANSMHFPHFSNVYSIIDGFPEIMTESETNPSRIFRWNAAVSFRLRSDIQFSRGGLIEFT